MVRLGHNVLTLKKEKQRFYTYLNTNQRSAKEFYSRLEKGESARKVTADIIPFPISEEMMEIIASFASGYKTRHKIGTQNHS